MRCGWSTIDSSTPPAALTGQQTTCNPNLNCDVPCLRLGSQLKKQSDATVVNLARTIPSARSEAFRQSQRSVSAAVFGVQIGALLEEELDYCVRTGTGCAMQCRSASRVCGIDVVSEHQRQLCGFQSARILLVVFALVDSADS